MPDAAIVSSFFDAVQPDAPPRLIFTRQRRAPRGVMPTRLSPRAARCRRRHARRFDPPPPMPSFAASLMPETPPKRGRFAAEAPDATPNIAQGSICRRRRQTPTPPIESVAIRAALRRREHGERAAMPTPAERGAPLPRDDEAREPLMPSPAAAGASAASASVSMSHTPPPRRCRTLMSRRAQSFDADATREMPA